MQEMTDRMWTIAHTLAADMALNQVSKNLVRQAAEYLRQTPQASLTDYLDRLEQLGDYFTAGKGGQLERADLRRVLERVKWPQDLQKTLVVLGWTARLVEYYTHHRQEALERCGLQFLQLRRGDHRDGIVRNRWQNTVWVAIAPAQWGRASRRHNVEIGDEVQVAVTRVTNPTRFDVEIVSVKQRAAPMPSRSEQPPEPPAPPEPEEVSDKAKDIFAAFQKIWAEQEGENAQ